MDIEREVEKILQEKGVSPPGMTQEQFVGKVLGRFIQAIPAVLEQTINGIAKEIMVEELERIGRGEPCRFWKPGKSRSRCIQPLDCLECPNYRPRSRRWHWGRFPKFRVPFKSKGQRR